MKSVLKATGLTGSSALIKLLAGVMTAKVVAVLLGPGGIGAYAQYQYVLTIATLIGTFGINTSIVREVGRAEAAQNRPELANIRTSGMATTWLVSVIVGGLVWLLREPLARIALNDARLAPYLAWIAAVIPLASVTMIQIAFLNGLRRIKDMARITVLASLAGLLVTVVLVWLLGEAGLLIGLIAAPVVSFWLGRRSLLATFAERGITPLSRRSLPQLDRKIVQRLVLLGFTVMITALLSQGTQFGARIWLLNTLGEDANGQFQAAWTISIGYMSLVLYAMAADYYPRLVQAQGDAEQLSLIINQQIKVALLLIAPVAIGLMAFSPLVVRLLYSAAFTETPAILRWQLMGDMLKALAWAFGFVLLAAGRSLAYFLVELLWNVLFLAGTIVLVPRLGLTATGSTFLLSYVVYALVTCVLANKFSQYRMSRDVATLLVVFGGLAACVWAAQLARNTLVQSGLLALVVAAAALYSAIMLERSIGIVSAIAARISGRRARMIVSEDGA